MEIIIRDATADDFLTIREIAHHTWPETYGRTLSAAQIQYMLGLFYSDEGLNSALADGQKFILLFEGKNPRGFASIQFGLTTGAARINKLYVVPESHGKGFGKLLMEKLIKMATAEKSERIVLNVNRFNKTKVFYVKFGFEIIGTEDIDIGNDYLMEDFIMQKILNPIS